MLHNRFVVRLGTDTTEEDLCSYLSDVGLKDLPGHKLDDKDNLFCTAVFRVSCHDLIYDETNWPPGVELRDWVFYHRDDQHNR